MADIVYLAINPDTRTIDGSEHEKLLGVEFDERAIRKYFKCPKIVGDNIDLAKSSVYINVQNASNEASGKDRYPVENFKVSGDIATFEWQPVRKVTARSGKVMFNVCVMTEDGREWNTTPAEGNVLDGLELLTPKELDTRGADYLGALTADATAKPETILDGQTAYVDGQRVTGTYVPLDTSDATAVANDIEEGKAAYIDGKKLEGTLPVNDRIIKQNTKATGYSTGTAAGITLHFIDVECKIWPDNDAKKMILDGEQTFQTSVSATDFGNAAAEDVKKGKTFTSANGLKITGTHEEAKSSGSGIDTSDATATAGDIVEGATAYAKGSKITGSLTKASVLSLSGGTVSASGSNIAVKGSLDNSNKLIAAYGSVTVNAASTDFGDATAADVKKGKTFTSSAGLKVIGTHQEPSGSGEVGFPDEITAGDTPIWSKTCNVSTRSDSTATSQLFSGSSVYFKAPKAGTYRFKFTAWTNSTSSTKYARAYLSTSSNMQTSPSGSVWWKDLPLSNATDLTVYIDATLTEGQRIWFFGKTADGATYGMTGSVGKFYNIQVCINWDNGTNQG